MATLVKVDRNGSKHYTGLVKCERCGGDGVYKWGAMISHGYGPPMPQYSGVCYKCNGAGKVRETWIERTPEYQAKLDAQREKRQAAKAAKIAEEKAKKEAERAEREAEWKKAQAEREAAEAARKAVSQHIGNVGERIQKEVTLESKVSIVVQAFVGFGTDTMRIYIMVDADGNKLVWKTTSILWKDAENYVSVNEGDRFTIKATIKAHGEYKGEKQTEIQRVKIV